MQQDFELVHLTIKVFDGFDFIDIFWEKDARRIKKRLGLYPNRTPESIPIKLYFTLPENLDIFVHTSWSFSTHLQF